MPPAQTMLTAAQGANTKLIQHRGWGENSRLRKESSTRIPFTPSVGAAAARLSRGGAARVAFFGTFRSTFREFHSSDTRARQNSELIASFYFNNCTAGNELGL